MSPSRRTFLHALTATGVFGASATPAAADTVDVPTLRREHPLGALGRQRRVGIVGAGIAGLTLAYELRKQGVDVKVFEARPRVGGKVKTIRHGDVVKEKNSTQTCDFTDDPAVFFNVGPARIPPGHRGIVGYCRELGVSLIPWVNDNGMAYFYDPALPSRVRLREIRAAMMGRISEAAYRDLSGGMRSVAATFGALSSGSYRGSSRAGLTAGSDGNVTPTPLPALTSTQLGSLASPALHRACMAFDLDQQPAMLQPATGMDAIPQALGQAVGEAVVLNAAVTAVRRDANGATLTITHNGQQHSEHFDVVVFAAPAPLVRKLDHDFTDTVTSALQRVRYTNACKLAFDAPRFWERDDAIYGGWSVTSQEITQVMYPSNHHGADRGALVAMYTFGGAFATRFGAMTPQQRIDAVLTQASAIHPELRTHSRAGISRAWAEVEWSEGGWADSAVHTVLQRPDGPYRFIGDYTTHHSGWMEGAVVSAHRAIRQIAE